MKLSKLIQEVARINKHDLLIRTYSTNTFLFEEVINIINQGGGLDRLLASHGFEDKSFEDMLRYEYSEELSASAGYFEMLFSLIKPNEILAHIFNEDEDYEEELVVNYKYFKFESLGDGYHIVIMTQEKIF